MFVGLDDAHNSPVSHFSEIIITLLARGLIIDVRISHLFFIYLVFETYLYRVDIISSQAIYLVIETYLYRVDIISSQAIFHICPVVILLYENKQSII